MNLYGYVLNDPLNLIDPNGKIVPALLAGAAALWAVAEVMLALYDAYSWAQDMINPDLCWKAKLGSTGLFAAGLILPGGG